MPNERLDDSAMMEQIKELQRKTRQNILKDYDPIPDRMKNLKMLISKDKFKFRYQEAESSIDSYHFSDESPRYILNDIANDTTLWKNKNAIQ